MNITCNASGSAFDVSTAELEMLERLSPTINGNKYALPPPSVHPEERMRRRYAFRNLRTLYKRSCDFSGRQIISPYSPRSGHKVYHTDIWWSDQWDALSYGREFDFNRPFFEQFRELYNDVPLLHHYVIQSENCDYINGAANCRDCYLSYDMDYCESCYYLTNGVNVRSTLDSLALRSCELCYECIDCENCYSLAFSQRCVGCVESYFLSGCRQCTHCIACSNLVNKEYYVFNKSVTKDEYERIRRSFRSRAALETFAAQAAEHHLRFPKKYYFGCACENFTGDNIKNLKNCFDCFECFELENCRHCHYVFKSANCMDVSIFGDNSQWLFNCQATGINCSNDICCMFCWGGSSNNFYCNMVSASSDCFGCSGLRNKKFCILNKQYSETAYRRLAAQIIEHMIKTREWGHFFPPYLSAFGVNETVAHDYLPLTESAARQRGYGWTAMETGPASTSTFVVQDSLDDIEDAICSKELRWIPSGKAFKIIAQELQLHRDLGLALPTESPEVRYQKRRQRKNPPRLYKRTCAKTGKEIMTSYGPERKEVVLCEEAFLEELS